MMLCPQAWPMPGQGVVLAAAPRWSGPSVPARADERGVEPVGAALDGEALVLEEAGEQVVGEVLLVAELGVLVDLVGDLEQHVGSRVDLVAPGGP